MSGFTPTLAVITSQLGTVSETFVRRHVEDLWPGKTVAVALHASHPFGGRWEAAVPTLFLDEWKRQPVVRLLVRLGFSLDRLREKRIERVFRQHRVESVLVEYLDCCVPFVPLLDRLQIPYVVQGHGIDLSAALRVPATAASYARLASARAILTRCEFHRQRLFALGLTKDKIHVNPGGIDLPEILADRPSGAHKRLLAVGRMTPKKGPIFLLEAFRQAALKDPELHLTYVGGGELAPAVRQFALASGLSHRIALPGTVSESEKLKLLGKCAIFLQHSITDPETGDEEGLPAAIQEAMANGMAVVTTRHSGIPELVVDGQSGVIVEEGDCESMAAAILTLSNNPGKIFEMGRRNREIIAGAHTWPHERRRLISHLGLTE